MTVPLKLVATLAVYACTVSGVHAQGVDVLGFEVRSMLSWDRPAGWSVEASGFTVELDSITRRGGRFSARTMPLGSGKSASASAVLGRTLPVELVRGRLVHISGWIQTDSVTPGYAGLWLRVDSVGGIIRLDNMALRGPRGTTDWQRYVIELVVHTAATDVVYGALHAGGGTAWFDDIEVEIDGSRYDPTAEPVWTPSQAEIEWVRRSAQPFATERAGSGFDDLRPVLDIVGDARIVSLGEGTHGTAEFFRMKHRLTELLATEKGFTVFAIEANMPESRVINEYVLTGRGDAKEALRGIYLWTWNTLEVLDMIEWMRAYNASGRGRIEFWGFDMQYPDVAMDSVRAFVTRADPAFVTTLDSAYAVVRTAAQRGRASDYGAWRRSAARVLDHLTANHARYVIGRDSMEVAWSIQNARIVLQAGAAAEGGDATRDSSMALNVAWMLDHLPAGTKAVLWAHNGHVQRLRGWMGAHLAAVYGNAMRVIGFTFHDGRYTASGPRGLTDYPVAPSRPGSIEYVLHAAGMPRMVLDLRLAARDRNAAWLLDPRPLRMIGAMAEEDGYLSVRAPDLFDALIYFEQTTAAKLLRRD